MITFIEKPNVQSLSEAADSLAEKLSTEAKPHAVIKLTSDEYELMRNAHIVGIPNKSNPIELVEIDKDKIYIAVCNESVNIRDLTKFIEIAELKMRIVRYSNV